MSANTTDAAEPVLGANRPDPGPGQHLLLRVLRRRPDVLEAYGAFDISVVSDLPLFVDPFLLFNSEDPEYQQLHERDPPLPALPARPGRRQDLDPGLIDAWYRFKEVKQNWLGFTLFGNDGAGLGPEFAEALHGALGDILSDFGEETVTAAATSRSCLIGPASAGTTSATSPRT